MKRYMVGAILKEKSITYNGVNLGKISLAWVNGMVGVIPVFDNKKDALLYADGDEKLIYELEI